MSKNKTHFVSSQLCVKEEIRACFFKYLVQNFYFLKRLNSPNRGKRFWIREHTPRICTPLYLKSKTDKEESYVCDQHPAKMYYEGKFAPKKVGHALAFSVGRRIKKLLNLELRSYINIPGTFYFYIPFLVIKCHFCGPFSSRYRVSLIFCTHAAHSERLASAINRIFVYSRIVNRNKMFSLTTHASSSNTQVSFSQATMLDEVAFIIVYSVYC